MFLIILSFVFKIVYLIIVINFLCKEWLIVQRSYLLIFVVSCAKIKYGIMFMYLKPRSY